MSMAGPRDHRPTSIAKSRPEARSAEGRSDKSWRRYLRFRGANARADVDDEIAFHIDLVASSLIAAGESPDTADVSRGPSSATSAVRRASAIASAIAAGVARSAPSGSPL